MVQNPLLIDNTNVLNYKITKLYFNRKYLKKQKGIILAEHSSAHLVISLSLDLFTELIFSFPLFS